MNSVKRKMIEEICQEKGITITDISYGWIALLKKGNVEKKLSNGNFYLNSRISVELAKDKYSTFELLKYHQIPIFEHQVIFNEGMMKEVEGINRNYECLKNNKKQVIKANQSLQGKEVYVYEKEEEKLQCVKEMFERKIEAVVVTDYREIEYEYRAIFLDGEIIYLYKKQKPYVIGDGKKTINVLIEEKLSYLQEPIPNLDLERVPKKDEKVLVGWKHNLSNGAIPVLVNEEDVYYEEVKEIALKTGKVLGLSFASIDISVTDEKKAYVMEANSNVCIYKFCELMPEGYEIGKRIYEKVIDKMFKEEKVDENRD